MSTQSFNDFEEELEQFFIRRQNQAKAKTNSSLAKIGIKASDPTDIYDQIPLFICDVLNIDQLQLDEHNIIFHAFGISFKNCLLHARVVSRSLDNDKYHKYIIDDGTASIEISIFRRQNDLEKLVGLEAEVESLKFENSAQNKLEMIDCLRNLLAKAKPEFNFSNIPVGSKILVYGKLSVFRGKVGIDVLSLLRTNNVNLEIEYKDLLIEWYSEKYKLNLNSKDLPTNHT